MSLPTRHAVLGTGTVGQTIARKLAALGLEVCMGSRTADNDDARAFASEAGARHGTFGDAAAFGEVIWLAVGGEHALSALEMTDAGDLAGKVLLDLTNPLDFSEGFPPSLSTPPGDSLAEAIQRNYPEARVVKTLNTVNAGLMVDPGRLGEPGDVFVSGNDPAAKETAVAILRAFHWSDPIDLGDLSTARGTEHWLPLWLRLMNKLGTADFNLKIVR